MRSLYCLSGVARSAKTEARNGVTRRSKSRSLRHSLCHVSIAPFTKNSQSIYIYSRKSLAEILFNSLESRTIYFFPTYIMSYVVASKVKELLKKSGMMSSGDLAEAASKQLEDALKQAVSRAKENGRKTVRPCDL